MASISESAQRLMKRSISSSVLSGSNPVAVDPTNPITLFIIQLFIIIVFTQGLGWVFKYIKQPKVIAEVIGGVILGPTIMGRIPGFTNSIFPAASITYLNLVSTIGLILFLFLVGLEVDVAVAKKNGRKSALISVAGMCLPFGLGAAVAIPVYHDFVDSSLVTFGHFLLFICVAMSITAFPVLCRILTATKLLDTVVGVVVLSAGVGNDVVGWVLLALTLALVSAGSGVTAVYILLCAVGWAIVLLWPIRKGFVWMCRRTGSIDNGPTPGMMVITLLIVFASAFVTGIIGVHPIFGGFMAGLIIPHEGGFAIAVTERIDDLVSMLFLPIYFVISGLQTNLGLLNTGQIWGYIILLCVVAFSGKFIGCAGVAKLLGFTYRESGAIGMLMSCKGLVELIVLNVGYSAGIIDQRLFSMLVVVAIVLTFITTPFTLWIYPPRFHTRGSPALERGRSDEKRASRSEFLNPVSGGAAGGREFTSRLLVVLQKLEHLAATMFITQLLEPAPAASREPWSASSKTLHKQSDLESVSDASSPSHDLTALPTVLEDSTPSPLTVRIDALKLIELTGRTFSVMQSAEKDQLLLTDDVLQLYRQFGRLRGIDVDPHISIVGQESFPAAVADYASDLGTELVLVPWTIPVVSSSAALIDPSSSAVDREGIVGASSAAATFENIFGGESTQGSPMYTHFIRNVFAKTTADVAVFVDRGFGGMIATTPGSGQHIYLPFFGGPDDRLALRLVVQLCHHANVTATVVRINHPDVDGDGDGDDATLAGGGGGELELSESARAHQAALQSNQLTVGGSKCDPQSRVISDTADNITWSYYTSTPPSSLDHVLRRISFWSHQSTRPLADAALYAEGAINAAKGSSQWRPLLIVTGRGRRGAVHTHTQELSSSLADRGLNPSVGAELRKTVGDTATALLLNTGTPSTASFLVVEAGQ